MFGISKSPRTAKNSTYPRYSCGRRLAFEGLEQRAVFSASSLFSAAVHVELNSKAPDIVMTRSAAVVEQSFSCGDIEAMMFEMMKHARKSAQEDMQQIDKQIQSSRDKAAEAMDNSVMEMVTGQFAKSSLKPLFSVPRTNSNDIFEVTVPYQKELSMEVREDHEAARPKLDKEIKDKAKELAEIRDREVFSDIGNFFGFDGGSNSPEKISKSATTSGEENTNRPALVVPPQPLTAPSLSITSSATNAGPSVFGTKRSGIAWI